jgi:Fic family protein
MDSLENFKAGHTEKGAGYKYFVPSGINREWRWTDSQLNALLERASIAIGELNSYARLVPNIDLFIHLHVIKEAVISSRIEGTQTNMGEALLPDEEISPERRDDWKEVKNYTEALNYAIGQFDTLPLSSRLLRQAHEILMQGVRGEMKMPGEYRTSQNWIGGASLSDARFIPPAAHYVHELMGDLKKFLHNQDIYVPVLIRAGIAHYQSETIHPFLDGNGRIGRLLITLYMVSEKILEKPLLYLSVFFEKNKSLYYENLTTVREKDDLLHWLKYFLIGIEETSRQAVTTLAKVLKLKDDIEKKLRSTLRRRTQSGLDLLVYLFKEPFVRISDVETVCGLSKKSANDLVQRFMEDHILIEMSGKIRNRMFVFQDYLRLFED